MIIIVIIIIRIIIITIIIRIRIIMITKIVIIIMIIIIKCLSDDFLLLVNAAELPVTECVAMIGSVTFRSPVASQFLFKHKLRLTCS